MLETIIAILLILWLVGLITGQTFSGVLHLLLIVILVIVVIRLLRGNRVI